MKIFLYGQTTKLSPCELFKMAFKSLKCYVSLIKCNLLGGSTKYSIGLALVVALGQGGHVIFIFVVSVFSYSI